MHHDSLIVLDYGSQTAQLIARRLRDAGFYSELHHWAEPREQALASAPKGIILSGGPASVYEAGAPSLPAWVLDSGLPVLGICYGMQLLTQSLGGRVAPSAHREYGPVQAQLRAAPIWGNLPTEIDVFMSHGDRIEAPPPGWLTFASSSNSPIAAIGDIGGRRYGVQFHPEVSHTPRGGEILRAFAAEVCGCTATWTPDAYIESTVEAIRAEVGSGRVLLGLSGGVDSSVAAALIGRAIGDQLLPVFIDTGLLRQNEAAEVVQTFRDEMGLPLVAVNASEEFLETLDGVTDPEEKRIRIGNLFVRFFEREAQRIGRFDYLAQGTIYPDVIESAHPDRPAAQRIKSHHNVGGLPADMQFRLLEPLRLLFKDEVRRVGAALGLPESILWRHPFPGPGLAIRCLGPITWERLECLRQADAIFRQELGAAGLLRGATAQAFAVLLPVKSVGVMGDGRSYAETLALRAVATDDFMTADWARLPYDLLAKVSARIVNEVQGINRVVYDITSKPPATIEWE